MKIEKELLLINNMGGNNNFYLLRIICALLVIFSHSFDLMGYNNKELYRAFVGHDTIYNLGTIGVSIFFLISGFLVTKSWENSSSIGNYFKKRILRIYPALIVVVFLTLFIIGPILTTVSLKTYFSSDFFRNYFNNFLVYKFFNFLPGVFAGNPNSNVNGALWTLPIEIRCYLIVAVFGFLSIFRKRFLILPIIVLTIFASIFSPLILMLYAYFFIGQAFYLYRDKIILNKYLALSALIIFFLIQQNLVLAYFANFFLLSYVAIYIVFRTKYINFEKYGDFSYGLYIYGFLVQQILIYYFKFKLNPYSLFLIAFPLTLLCAVFSWYSIEKPALKYKNKNIINSRV